MKREKALRKLAGLSVGHQDKVDRPLHAYATLAMAACAKSGLTFEDLRKLCDHTSTDRLVPARY